jgi:hypothetical protein
MSTYNNAIIEKKSLSKEWDAATGNGWHLRRHFKKANTQQYNFNM